MPSTVPQKRSVSPSAEEQRAKRSGVNLRSYKPVTSTTSKTSTSNTSTSSTSKSSNSTSTASTTSSLPDNASTKLRIKIKIKLKTQTNPAPPINQSEAINPPLRKLAARGPLRKLGGAESNAIGIPVRQDDTDKAAPSPKLATRESFIVFEAQENDDVPVQVPSNIKSDPLTDQFTPINVALSAQASTRRDPLRPFGAVERKATARWMQSNKAISSRGEHAAAFQDLLHSLGCQDPSFNLETLLKLEKRLHLSIVRIKKVLKECGAITFSEDDDLEKTPIFADWTVVWLENEWDGVYDTRTYYTNNLERFTPASQEEDEPKAVLLPVDEPFEEEVEILVVEDPNEVQTTTSTRSWAVRDREYYENPYGMADW